MQPYENSRWHCPRLRCHEKHSPDGLESTDFVDAIRKAISIGGDSDTPDCLGGGLAEAFYKDIPDDVILEVWNRLTEEFRATVHDFASRTAYAAAAENCLPEHPIPDWIQERATPDRLAVHQS